MLQKMKAGYKTCIILSLLQKNLSMHRKIRLGKKYDKYRVC